MASESGAGRAAQRTERGSWRARLSGLAAVPFEQFLLVLAGLWFAVGCQWISDDGYIYLAYVDNLVVHGAGAVFNPGEYVEGCTSIGWFALLAAVRWVGRALLGNALSGGQTVLLLSHALTLAALVQMVRLNRRMIERSAADPPRAARGDVNIPLILFVTLAPFQHFATSGLETPLITIYIVLVAGCLLAPGAAVLPTAALIAAGPLIRPDLGLVSIVLVGWALARHGFWRGVLAALLAALPNVAIEAWRIRYYAALLPNTFYAKTGIDGLWPQGLAYLQDVMLAYGVHWLLVLALVAAAVKQRLAGQGWGTAGRLTLLAGALLYGGYVVSVGGDFMHGRFWLPALLMLILSFTGLGADAFGALLGDWPLAARVPARVLAVALLGGLGLSLQPVQLLYGTGERQQLYAGISSELHAYRAGNANLHAWSADNEHTWAVQGARLGELAEQLDTEAGMAAGGIGQRAFYGQAAGRAYIYDQLALTRPSVARIDMGHIERRIGHKKLAPGVLAALHPRVDFFNPYFDGYAAALQVPGLGLPALVNLELLEPLERAGLLTGAQAAAMRGWLAEQLQKPVIDANFIVFLHERLPADDPLYPRVQALHERCASRSAWRQWLDTHRATLEALDEQLRGADSFEAALRIALRNHRLPALPFLPDAPSWTIQQRTESTSLLAEDLWTWRSGGGIEIAWRDGRISGRAGGERHTYLSTGPEPFDLASDHEPLALTPGVSYACELRGSCTPGMDISVFLLEYGRNGRQIAKESWPFTGGLLVQLPTDPATVSFRLAIRVAGAGEFALDEITLHGPGDGDGGGSAADDGPRAAFLALAEEAVAELAAPEVTQAFIHAYLVRALCAAFDVTSRAGYLEAAGDWARAVLAGQAEMQPRGAYYMGYHRKPGASQGEWYSADSASIGMGVLAVAGRTMDPVLRARCLASVEAYAGLVLREYVRDTGGITDGIWELSDDEWWCSTALNAALLYQLGSATGDARYTAAADRAVAWLLEFDYRQASTPTFEQGAPTVLFYMLEAYAAALGQCDAALAPRVRTRMVELAGLIAERIGPDGWADSSWWGAKLGGLPAHLLICARELEGADAGLRTLAERALADLCRRHYAADDEEAGVRVQRLAFTLMSLAEAAAPGRLYTVERMGASR